MKDTRYVVFDVETTGLSPGNGDRIIEIGAIAIENGIIVKEFDTLIDAGRAITRLAQQVHGITQDMLAGKPKPEEVMPAFAAFIHGSILVAHNAGFDMSFIRQEFHRHQLVFNHRYICTLEMSRRRYPNLQNHKLETVYRHLMRTNGEMIRNGIAIPFCVPGTQRLQAHRALDDARMVAAIWLAMEGK